MLIRMLRNILRKLANLVNHNIVKVKIKQNYIFVVLVMLYYIVVIQVLQLIIL